MNTLRGSNAYWLGFFRGRPELVADLGVNPFQLYQALLAGFTPGISPFELERDLEQGNYERQHIFIQRLQSYIKYRV